MPRYFFNIRDGDDLELDPDGQVLPDKDAARNEARFYESEILRDAAMQHAKKTPSIEVTDARGEIILRFGCEDLKDEA